MNELELTIQIWVRNAKMGGGALELRESVYLKASDFMEMCRILGQFQQLAQKIQKEQSA